MKVGLNLLGEKEVDCNRRRFERDQVLNALYYFHAELYPKRIRSLGVELAKEIIARNTYPYLPETVFTDSPGEIEAAEVESCLRELDLHIKAKIALDEPVPLGCDSAAVFDGVLILKKTNLFQVSLTLSHLDRGASWKPLNFRMCLKCSHEGLPERSSLVSALEFKVFEALLKVYFATISSDMSLLHALRMFYVQSLLNIRSSSVNVHDANFIEDSENNILIYRFWRAKNPRYFSETICIIALSFLYIVLIILANTDSRFVYRLVDRS
jgi:hypothetical protein